MNTAEPRDGTAVRIRAMTDADLDAVAANEAASFSMPWSREAFRRLLLRREVLCLVAEVPADPREGGAPGARDAEPRRTDDRAARPDAVATRPDDEAARPEDDEAARPDEKAARPDDEARTGGAGARHPESRPLVGHAVLWRAGTEAELANLAVAPRYRGRGIGGRLLDEALSAAQGAGATSVFLEVRRSGRKAQHLYRSRGFQEVGLRRNYYHRPREDALVMAMDLAGAHRGEEGGREDT